MLDPFHKLNFFGPNLRKDNLKIAFFEISNIAS